MYSQVIRWQQASITAALATSRVLLLEGPRQCGKTTLLQAIQGPGTTYLTLDDPQLQAAARSDPRGFVQHGDTLLCIDEIQRVPELLPAIKIEVDTNQNPGRFLLTGSANIQSLPGVTESLAGRARKLRLRTFSQGERMGTTPRFLQAAFAGQFFRIDQQAQTPVYNKDLYIQTALQGGYPEALRLPDDKARRAWHKDYIERLMERDLRDIVNIRRKDSMLKLLSILASWSSKFMDVAKIGSGLAVQRPTVESYINALEALYLVERVAAWAKTDYARAGKRDKIFMTDSGLMAATLRWSFDQVRHDGELNGKLLETFVFNQLAADIDAQDDEYSLTHYRDREQREIDFIIEDASGALLGVEVKAGSALNNDTFKHLRWFKTNMSQGAQFTGVVLYTGDAILSFGDNMWAVPISGLWA
jgi:uncharacterized protein